MVFGACPALQAEPPKPEELPPNVEKLIVKTGSAALAEIPFYVRVPKGYTGQGPNRVLFLCPVHNGNGLKTITGNAQTRHLIEAADERQWFVVSVTFDQKGADVRNRNVFYYYPEKFSGKAVLDALAQVKAKYRSIDTDALLLQGFSGGAQFVHRFAIWKPERVTAVAVNSTSWFDAPDDKSLLPAWLVTIGESDRSYDHTLTFVEQLRKAGAAPIFRSYTGMLHEGTEEVDKLNAEFLMFYDDLTRPMLGKPRSLLATHAEPPLKPAAMPFVGDSQEWRYGKNTAEAAEDIADDLRVYLPSENIANRWGKAAPQK